MAKLPNLENDAEVAEFWDTHDLADYLEEFEEITDAQDDKRLTIQTL